MLRDIRLGDDIDDFCVRCKRLTNHLVVSVLNQEPAKVRCRTCHSDHDYRHEQAPPPKVDLRKAALFNEVLKKVDPEAGPVPVEPESAPEPAAAPAAEAAVETAPEAPPAKATGKSEAKPAAAAQPKARRKARA